MQWHSIRTRLIVTLLIISLLPVALLGYFSYQQSSGILESETQKLTNQLVGESNKVLDRQLNEIIQVSTMLFTNQTLLDLLRAEQSEDQYENYLRQSEIEEILRNITNARMDIQSVSIVGESGEFFSTGSVTGGSEVELQNEEWFQETLEADGKTVWFPTQYEARFGSGQDQWSYALARSINAIGSEQKFVFLIEVRESSLSSLLKDMEMTATGTVRIVDDAGAVVSSLNEDELGKAETSEAYTFLQDESAGSVVTDGKLISYAPLELAGWYLVVEVPMASLLEQVNRIRTFTFIIVGVSAVAALVVALLIGLQFARPIERMRGVMELAGEGDLTAQAAIKGKSEIAQLNGSYMELIGRFRNFVGRTKQAGEDLNKMAQDLIKQAEQNNVTYREITEATESIAAGADQQAQEAETSAELVNELLSKWRESLGEAEKLEQVMAETLQVSENGQTSVRELQDKNQMTEQEIERLGNNLELLEDRVGEVNNAKNLIDDIMDKTKILALNAAIEAHRAGQDGRGFLVVADEVQRLSQQVLSATNSIGSSIDAIQKAMKSTWNSMKLTNEAMEMQRETVKGTDEAFQSIRVQMDEAQSQLTSVMNTLSLVQQFEQRMSDAIQNISAVAQQSAAATEEVAALAKDQESSSDHLVTQSHSLGEIVQTLEEELAQFKVAEQAEDPDDVDGNDITETRQETAEVEDTVEGVEEVGEAHEITNDIDERRTDQLDEEQTDHSAEEVAASDETTIDGPGADSSRQESNRSE